MTQIKTILPLTITYTYSVKFYKPLRVTLTVGIILVWLVNGLICKVFNLVPRHQFIVSEILGEEYASFFTKTIGVSEILMVVWIISGIKSRWCAVFQMVIVGVMNIMEFVLVPDLLLFGRMNIVVASVFIFIIYCNEFILKDVRTKYSISN